MLHTFKKGNSAKDIADRYAPFTGVILTIKTVRNWFKILRLGNFDLKDSATTDTDLIKAMLVENLFALYCGCH